MERPPLSERQREILAVIRTSLRERGHPPTMRDICARTGMASTSSAAHQVNVLEARGYITRDVQGGHCRMITIVDDPDPDEVQWGTQRPGQDPVAWQDEAYARRHAAQFNLPLLTRVCSPWTEVQP